MRAIAVSLVCVFCLCHLAFAKAPQAEKEKPAPLELDGDFLPFVPKQPRTVAEQDRIEAAALFAAGRRYEHEQKFVKALKMYQRALRYDPDSLPILRQIVPLCFNVGRNAEGMRYALKIVQLDPSDLMLVRRMGAHLIDRGDLEGALGLFEKAMQSSEVKQDSPVYVILQAQMADLYYLQKEYKKAADSFEVVMKAVAKPADFGLTDRQKELLTGEGAQLFERAGTAYLHAGKTKEAIAAFQKAHEASPNKGVHAFHMAQVYLQSDEPAKALAELQEYFQHQLQSKGVEPYELLAKILEELKKDDELIGRLEKHYASDKKNVALRYYLARQYLEAKQFDKAKEHLVELLEESPKPEGYEGLVQIYKQTQSYASLLEILGKSVEKSEDGRLVHSLIERLGPEGEAISKDSELVQKLLEAGRELKQKDADQLTYGMRVALGLLAVEVNKVDEGAEFFRLALETQPDDPLGVYQEWGLALLVGEHYEQAAGVFQEAVDKKLAPQGDPTLLYHIAGALEMAGKTDKALAAAREALQIRDTVPLLYSRIAWIYYHAKRYDEAIKAYDELIEKFDGTEDSKRARLILSSIYVIKKNMPKAEELLEEVLDQYPDDPGANNDLGYLWADQGKFLKRALRMIEIAIESEPDNQAYQDSMGWVLFKLGRYEDALKWLKKAAAEEDPDGVILDHLGDCYFRLGEQKKAEDCWQRALESMEKEDSPEKERLEQIKKKLKLHQGADSGRSQPADPDAP